ncbi:MAG: patatin-like phospholipase family protein, partial [Alphaproteobacteria bacterium]|nr:patatin-like phospholipase family protein [Alphaproteobacteria bacterium]
MRNHSRTTGPKIGLALGSGAARGWSLIGIIEGLAALGIAPQLVAGTSIGALVGAAFATGRLEQLKTRMENFGRLDTAGMFDFRLASGGLIQGRRVETFLAELGIEGDIEALPVRFGSVATELATGREIWLQKGPIGRAVRASIGMPGIFTPERLSEGDGWLIDGGLVDPVPISLARALGADIVIAVDLNANLVGRRFDEAEVPEAAPAVPEAIPDWLKTAVGPILERMLQPSPEFPSYFEVLANSLNIMQDRITRMRLAGDPPDVLLRPSLPNFGWMDFHRAREAIAEGRECVVAAEASIRKACRQT